ncbi:TPA: DUF4177 domain-containing protein [Bacillus cereus]|nr:DUF4177 domain-containing protein [Bacillus cereus]
MKKIEYREIGFHKLTRPHYQELDIDKLNHLGKDGWELVVVVSGNCIFKREVTV